MWYFSFKGQITIIGRNSGQVDYTICSDSFIPNSIISRIHARVVRCHDGYHIHDDSRNGVYVNSIKIAGD